MTNLHVHRQRTLPPEPKWWSGAGMRNEVVNECKPNLITDMYPSLCCCLTQSNNWESEV